MLVIATTARRPTIRSIAAALLAGTATLAGVGTVQHVGSGSLQSQSSTVTGSGTTKSTGTGTLASGASTIVGTGTSGTLISGSGALASQASTLAGTGTTKSVGTGALASQAATLAGVGTVVTPIKCSYANTGGTGNRTGSITVTSDATNFSTSTPPNLVNGSFTTNAANSWSATGAAPKFIKFDFGTARVIRQARWYQENSGTGSGTWQWFGSNDDSSYTAIGATFTLGTNSGGIQIHRTLIDNVTFYRYYKLVSSAGTINGSPWFTEIEFFIDGATDSEPDTAYTYPRGGGTDTIGNGFGNVPGSGGNGTDRSSLITVTASFSPGSGSVLSNMVDGGSGNNSTDSVEITNGLTNMVMKFDFGASNKQRIDEITWEQQTTTDQGNYDLSGSDDDSSYTTLSSNFSLVNGSLSRTKAFTNTAAYRYYKLTQVSGTTSNSPWVHEIFFKCAPKTTGTTA